MAPGWSNVINGNQLRNSSSISSNMPGPHMPFQTAGAIPPPLPPRQPVQSYLGYNDYRPYNSSYGYGNYGYGGGYRGYGGYGSFGSYNPYSSSNYGQIGGHSGDVENRFQQYAEESTRSTFRVVETVVHTFSSITMMLESTYFALTNSFRAILSVADNVGRLRSTIGQLLSTFALIRALKWIYRRILFMLGLQTQSAVVEDLWQQSMSQLTSGERTTTTTTTNNERVSPWMNVLLLGLFVAIPYLIHKISSNIRQSQIKVNDPKEWVKSEDPVCVATAMFDFAAVSNEELSLRAGQKIWLAPRSLQSKSMPGWWIATDNRNVGLVPANYVTIVGQLKRKPESESNGNVITPTLIPTSVQNETAPDEQVNLLEPSTDERSTDFSENNIKDDLL